MSSASTVENPIDRLDVTVSTPDEMVFGRVVGRREVQVWLAPGYYDRATETDLVRQFGRLGRLMFAARMREYYRLRSLAFDRVVTGESPPSSERDQEFVDRRSELVAEGASPDGRIHVTAVGMGSWTVTIDAGTLQALEERSFCAAMAAAGNALVADQYAKVRGLKDDVYT